MKNSILFEKIELLLKTGYLHYLKMIEYFKQNTRTAEILFHISFWTAHFVYRLYLTGYFQDYDAAELYTQLILLPVRIFITYFAIYFVVRKYLFQKRIIGFVFWTLVLVICSLLLRQLVLFKIIYNYNIYPNYDNITFWNLSGLAHSTIYIFPVVTLAVIIFVVHEWFKKEKLRLETQKKKLEAELKYLKNQINPHFLFNTINNIYSLVLEQSKKAPQALLKLSDMLSYLLYDSNTDRIALSKEIKNLQDYIDLEQFRYTDNLEVVFNYENKTTNVFIPPLLLLPFVENAFKHGAGESLDNSWIHINLKEENNKLTFKVENSIDEKAKENKNKNGIGLQNVRRRLDLMFHNKYELKTLKSNDSFIAILNLDLNNGSK